MPDQTGPPGDNHRLHSIAAGVLALVIAAIAQFALQRGHNTLLLLVSALVLAAISLWSLAFIASVAWLVGRCASLGRNMSRRARVLVAAGMGTVLLVGAAVTVVRLSGDDACPQALELRILASSDGLQTTRDLAQAYAKVTARDNDGCPTVYPYVYAAGTSAVSGALARQWADANDEHPLEQLGPRPDIWLPDSMLDVRQVRDIVVKGTLPSPLERVTSIASSPIVLAGTDVASVPHADADTLPALVSALLNRRVPGPSLSAADPVSSTAGLLAADVYLRDAEGEIVAPDVARRRQQIVSDSASSFTDEVSLLCGYQREKKAPEAVLVSLRSWQRFVTGKALGADCPVAVAPPSDLPDPVVVTSAPALDQPFVQFTWTGARQRQAVDRFRDWLRSAEAGAVLHGSGLDRPLAACSDLDRNACLPDEPKRTLNLYEQAKRPGRVLLAVDTSGSMSQPAGSAATSRFTVAARGVGEALGQLGPRDEFGLWSFPISRGRSSYELVGVAAGSAQHRTAIVDALRAVKPAGTTPLYATIVAGLSVLTRSADDKRVQALVVLTDGEDTSARPGLGPTLEQVGRAAGADVRLYVIATGEARCDGPDGRTGPGPLYQLTRAGHGQCLSAGPEEVPDIMAQLFETLWSGR
ncbi:substrate-binding domain-containing protein [Actinoplanes sp. HUAS TT8]|uniref:vWA domain-containing protein n=1 Tax=Actinoplanes sp. HUAS TT8 TaxID=3447453 RepID=UPI003F523C98